MKKVKDSIKKIVNLVLKFTVFFINIFFPKRDGVILIGGWFGERFADNSKYLYLYLNENKSRYRLERVIFITRNRKIYEEIKNKLKFEVYMMYSVKSLYYHLIARIYIIDQSVRDDLIGWLGINSIKINLWHGLPLKKIGHEKNIENPIQLGNWQESYLLTCSKFGDTTLGEAFKCDIDRRLKGMYPRNYYLINDNKYLSDDEEKIIKRVEKQREEGKKIIIYLPTFRDKEKLKFLGEESQKNIEEFFEFLKKNNYFLISKVHFAGTNGKEKNRDNIYLNNENFINIDSKIDVYPILKTTDILITDYSSVYFDYLYLNKEIIFFPYDLEYYRDGDRGLLFDYNEITPGNKVYNIFELKIILEKLRNTRDDFKDEREKLLQKCFENTTIEETVKNILQIIK